MYSNRPGDPYAELALGLISAQSFPAIVGMADRMLKESSVTLVGYEQIGSGYCTAVIRGRTPDVRIAIETGRELATQFGQETTSTIIPRPMPNLEEWLPIGSRLAKLISGQENNKFRDQAVGLIETRGFCAMVGASDAMLKSADVTLSAYHKTGSGLCTAIVRGTVANVGAAIEVGMVEAERIGELHAVMVIPRPLDDLERTLPIADCWVEQLQPVKIPLNVEVPIETETRQPLQPLDLPIAEPMEIPVEVPVEIPIEPLRQPLRLEQPLEMQSFEPQVFEPQVFEPEVFEPIPLNVEPIEPEILKPLPTDDEILAQIPLNPEPPEPHTIDIDASEAEALALQASAVESQPIEVNPIDSQAATPPIESPPIESPSNPAKPTIPKLKKGFKPRPSRPPRKP